LARRLVASLADDSLGKKFLKLTKCRRLIIDELGYLPYERQQATLMFQLRARRYERLATIVTTNKGFAQWGEIFGGDLAVASAILDRLLHHATVINIRGPSYRLKDRQTALGFSVDLAPAGRSVHKGGESSR
jgi:DNA replication protein DnaC